MRTSTTSLSRTRYAEFFIFAKSPHLCGTFQAGTFWYHSHVGTQYCDGLRGPIVVYDPNDPHKSLYDVDDGK